MPRLLILYLLLPADALAELEIGGAWIKQLPPAVPVRAGYMTIHNPDAEARRIVGVGSDSFARVEIHQSLMQDGMMRMQRLPDLVIEPGATVTLAPGGLHLMMMQPAAPTLPGDVYRLHIELDDGSVRHFEMTVKE